jgi:predicted MFS family arabinose efflux permease
MSDMGPSSATAPLAARPAQAASTCSNWWAVTSVAVSAFVLVTSEFLPIGLLSSVSAGLQVPLSRGSWLVTTPGFVAALSAPAFVAYARRVDRRKLLASLTWLMAASDLVAAASPSIHVMLVARAMLGLAVGGFWTFAPSVGRRLVTDRVGDRATALIMGGISAGTVFGVPAGALLGELIGWRTTFGILAALSVAAAVAQLVALPRMLATPTESMQSPFSVLRVSSLMAGLSAAAFMVAGHFAGFTYLQPLLSNAAGMQDRAKELSFLIFGVAGLVGTATAERLASKRVRLALAGAALAAALALLCLAVFSFHPFAQVPPNGIWNVVVAIWGAAFGALPVCLQVWMFKATPDQLEASSALSVVTFQIALGAGAYVGGLAVHLSGLTAAFAAGCALSLVSAVILRCVPVPGA